VYKRQIYQIAESNRIEKIDSVAKIESNRNFFCPNWNALVGIVGSWGQTKQSVRVQGTKRAPGTPERDKMPPAHVKVWHYRQCWLQMWVLCTIVLSCCDCTASSAPSPTNVQTQLDSTMHTGPTAAIRIRWVDGKYSF